MRKSKNPLTGIEALVLSHPFGKTPRKPVLGTQKDIQAFAERMEKTTNSSREKDRRAMLESRRRAYDPPIYRTSSIAV